MSADWHEQAQALIQEEKYEQASQLYEQAIEAEPKQVSYYWHLGITYLLQGKEEDAQATWLWGLFEISGDTDSNQRTEELGIALEQAAQQQVNQENWANSELLRRHLRELDPENINNLLQLLKLSLERGTFQKEDLEEWQVASILSKTTQVQIDLPLLRSVIEQLLEQTPVGIEPIIEVTYPYFKNDSTFIEGVLIVAVELANKKLRPDLAISIGELCHQLDPSYSEVLKHLSLFNTNSGNYTKGIEWAKAYYKQCEKPIERLIGNYFVLRALLNAGAWMEVHFYAHRHQELIQEILSSPPKSLSIGDLEALLLSPIHFPYITDQAHENQVLKNKVSQIFQRFAASSEISRSFSSSDFSSSKVLRIGYIGSTFRKHSVGWLCRWLLQNHNREQFHITLYLVYQQEDDLTQNFKRYVDAVRHLDNDVRDAEKIREDEIDILIDVDSITYPTTCKILSQKPAPIQVTWLGFDASGLPSIDYFIADPYVLPENAQDYYQETIWRLPETYVAVDGFEVGVPKYRREDLGIPADAVVYWSAQKGLKRHPDTVRLQMKILKAVPNSHFLIKGFSDQNTIQEFFKQIAEEEGVEFERLHFLPIDLFESDHRANLGLADVVLDTYPYNGATTTLETLWMGIPLVTRVGGQFSARNSYAFLTNVGVYEGIAYSDEEYIEWGIKFGKDESLRKKVHWKLFSSRKTAPLWNSKKFAQQMETAYKQMWEKYVSEKQVSAISNQAE